MPKDVLFWAETCQPPDRRCARGRRRRPQLRPGRFWLTDAALDFTLVACEPMALAGGRARGLLHECWKCILIKGSRVHSAQL